MIVVVVVVVIALAVVVVVVVVVAAAVAKPVTPPPPPPPPCSTPPFPHHPFAKRSAQRPSRTRLSRVRSVGGWFGPTTAASPGRSTSTSSAGSLWRECWHAISSLAYIPSGAYSHPIILIPQIHSLVRLLSSKGVEPFASYNFKQVYPVAATGIWAVVLWLFEYHPDKLHPSLAKVGLAPFFRFAPSLFYFFPPPPPRNARPQSMVELYHDSNTWRAGWRDFIPTPASAMVIAFFTAQLSSQGKLMDLFDLSKTRL